MALLFGRSLIWPGAGINRSQASKILFFSPHWLQDVHSNHGIGKERTFGLVLWCHAWWIRRVYTLVAIQTVVYLHVIRQEERGTWDSSRPDLDSWSFQRPRRQSNFLDAKPLVPYKIRYRWYLVINGKRCDQMLFRWGGGGGGGGLRDEPKRASAGRRRLRRGRL